MSQDHVEIVRRANRAFNESDWDAWREVVDPAAVYVDGSNHLDTPAVIRGRAAMQQALIDWGAAFQTRGAELEQLIERGKYVLAVTRWWGVGAGSGIETAIRECIVWRARDGVLVEGRAYPSLHEAIDALGLEE